MTDHPHPRLHLPWLDWVRFLSAVMVLVVHARGGFLVDYGRLPAGQKTPPTAAAFALTRLGNEAVIVFFVLSGYLVAGKAADRMRRAAFDPADYAVDRFARIYLPYVPALLFTWGCAVATGGRPTAASFACNLFALQGVFGESFVRNAPLWSVAYEVWFYVAAGCLGGFVRHAAAAPGRAAAAAGGLAVTAAVFTVLSPTYLFCWLAGGLAYFYRAADRRVAVLGVAVGGYAVAGAQVRFASESVDTARWAALFPSLPVLQLLIAGAVAAVLTQLVARPPVTAAGRRLDRLGTTLAAFSYTLYLTHYPTLSVVERYLFAKQSSLSVESVARVLAACLIAAGVAWVLYLLFERNTVAFKGVLRWLVGRPAAVPPSPGRG